MRVWTSHRIVCLKKQTLALALVAALIMLELTSTYKHALNHVKKGIVVSVHGFSIVFKKVESLSPVVHQFVL